MSKTELRERARALYTRVTIGATMKFKPGDRVVTQDFPGATYQGSGRERLGTLATVFAVGPFIVECNGKRRIDDYKIIFDIDGERARWMEPGLRPYYDGNEKTSWPKLKGIWQPKPEKVNT